MTNAFRYALLTSSALALTAGSAHADYTLNILHINDLHSRIESINQYDSTCSAEDEEAGECFGGVARVKTKIDERREALGADGANVLVLDAGDQFQGSLFYTTYKGEAAAEFMNMIGFDAMAIGNHEFDDGPEALAAFIDVVDVPLISGNTVAADGSVLDGTYEPYIIEEIGGERVAIVSVLATDTDETSSPGPDITFEDEVAYLQGAVEELEGQGIDKIILLSHVGLPRDREIAAAVDGIDVIVGGHSHTLLSNTDDGAAGPYPTMVANPSGTEVPIVQAYAYSKYVGELQVTFDDEGNVISAEGDPILLDASVEPDAAVAARVAELAQPIEEMKSEVIGETTAAVDGSRETCRAGECEMGNLVTDAMLERVRDQGIDFAITNGGGLRASIDAGEVTMGEVLTVLPFQNTLSTFQLAGEDVVAALENGVGQIEEGAGRFPQVSGLKYAFDPSRPAGERISDVMVADGEGGFEPIDPQATYGVVSNNFMRGGGDGYSVFAEEAENAYDYGPGLETVLAEYLADNQPYEPYTDGRIAEVAANAQPMEEDASEEPAGDEPAGEEAADAGEPAAEDMAGDDMAGEEATPDDTAAGTGIATPDLPEASAEMTTTAPTIADETDAAVPEEAAEQPMTDDGPAEETMAEDTMAEETMPEEAATDETASDEMASGEAATEDAMAAPAGEDAAAPDAAETTGEDGMAEDMATEDMATEDMATEDMATEDMATEDMATEGAAEEMTGEAQEVMEAETAAADPAASEPPVDEAMAEAGAADRHVVVAGDTLWDLAVDAYGDGRMWTRIAEANPDIDAERLVVGVELVVPAAE